jgi:hypothetical protein
MSPLEKSYYINTGKDGILADTIQADVENLVSGLQNHPKIVLHFHGGLVSKEQGLESAVRLKPHYLEAGAYPIFFIWESDLFKTLSHNLDEIDKEKIFKQLLTLLIKFAVGKLIDIEGGKATGQLQLPDNIEVAVELQKVGQGEEPYSDITASAKLKELNQAERDYFETTLVNNPAFQTAVQAVVTSADPEDEKQETSSKGVLSVDRRSEETLMSPEVIDKLKEDVAENEGKGLLSTALLIKRAGEILVRVIHRFVERRDHGVYCTVVEEILRDLYLANVGAGIWGMMKKETVDTFENVDQEPVRGGWFFVNRLGKRIAADEQLEITLVGHSAGAIFVCNLLRYIEKRRADPAHPFPADFKFKNVVFLAPACNFKLFSDIITNYSHLFENFRLFTLNDGGESGKPMVPVLYTRSLLYFISGVLETEHDNPDQSAYDLPIVGMQRYFLDSDTYQMAEVAVARNFINEDPRRVVWATENRGVGLASSASEHGGFAEEPATLASIKHIIQQGWDV